jgi:hypothetical protein
MELIPWRRLNTGSDRCPNEGTEKADASMNQKSRKMNRQEIAHFFAGLYRI